MKNYALKRFILMFPTILGACTFVFILIRVIPGDICLSRWVDYGTDLNPALLDSCRAELGLNTSLVAQYFKFLTNILTLDLGVSMWTEGPIYEEIMIRASLSLQLAIMALLSSVFLAIPLGIISALKQDQWLDYLIRMITIFGIAIPPFWLGIMLILIVMISSNFLNGSPWTPPIEYTSFFSDPAANLSQLIWPLIAAGYRYMAIVARLTRVTIIEVLRQEYITVAIAKGLSEHIIIFRHALRNSLLPIITIIGMEFSLFVGGLAVIEHVFNLNGVGKLLVESVLWGDYNMVQGLTMFIVLIFVLINFFIDILYGWIDPRIRY